MRFGFCALFSILGVSICFSKLKQQQSQTQKKVTMEYNSEKIIIIVQDASILMSSVFINLCCWTHFLFVIVLESLAQKWNINTQSSNTWNLLEVHALDEPSTARPLPILLWILTSSAIAASSTKPLSMLYKCNLCTNISQIKVPLYLWVSMFTFLNYIVTYIKGFTRCNLLLFEISYCITI